MCGDKFLCQWLWHSLAKLCTKKLWKSVNICKSYSKKTSGTFFSWTQCINWLYWLTRCGPQPLQRISASWYRPVHHLGLCALPMLRCSSFLAYTPNWPVALFHLLLHPPGTLYLLRFDCAKTFSLSNATWKPIYSNSLIPPVLHQAPLYLRT